MTITKEISLESVTFSAECDGMNPSKHTYTLIIEGVKVQSDINAEKTTYKIILPSLSLDEIECAQASLEAHCGSLS